MTRDEIRHWLVLRTAEIVGVDHHTIDKSQPFIRYGFDSLITTRMLADLAQATGRSLSPTLAWEYPNIDSLASYIAGGGNQTTSTAAGIEKNAQVRNDEPIAIVGMACRFPGGAQDPSLFWSLLCDGFDGISEVPKDRWNVDSKDSEVPESRRTYLRRGGFLHNIDCFDPMHFHISPREAEQMDPQQRLMLELTWEAIEDAGIAPKTLRGGSVGVFMGVVFGDYDVIQDVNGERATSQHTTTGSVQSIIANRISYVLGLSGPSCIVNAACASSLLAVHLACQSIRNGECSVALAGGVQLNLALSTSLGVSLFGALSPDGACRTFDATANGYVRGEGAGVMVLRSVSEARRRGDRIYAIIRGSSTNNNGAGNGLTAPNVEAQRAVIVDAYQRAQVEPVSVQYVELHGTGTILGDPIEAAALGAAYTRNRDAGSKLLVGSVKTNIGHLEASAGIAGLIKTALAIYHRYLPPSLHFKRGNPYIDFEALRIEVVTSARAWPELGDGILRAGVSSFGFGGTNAHAILESWPRERTYVLPLAAESPKQLEELATRMREWLMDAPQSISVKSVCSAAGTWLTRGAARAAFLGTSRRALAEALVHWSNNDAMRRSAVGGTVATSGSPGNPVFVFSGLGSQWPGMIRQVWDENPAFVAALNRCDASFEPVAGWSIVRALFDDNTLDVFNGMDRLDVIVPVLVAVQIAMARLWMAWGIEPGAVVGHSVGEIAAAHIAGALNLHETMLIAHQTALAYRASVESGTGMFVFVGSPVAHVQALLGADERDVHIAGQNDPGSCIVSGVAIRVRELIDEFTRHGIFHRILGNVYAHCTPVRAFTTNLTLRLDGRLAAREPRIPFMSTVTGAWISSATLGRAHWKASIEEPVRFSDAIEALWRAGYACYLELSPHAILARSIDTTITALAGRPIVLASQLRGDAERTSLLNTLGRLFELGIGVKWDAFHAEVGLADALPANLSLAPKSESQEEWANLVVLSARTEPAVNEYAARIAEHVRLRPQQSLGEMTYGIAKTRATMEYRLACVTRSRDDLLKSLDALALGQTPANTVRGHARATAPEVVFVFPGQGSQWVGMARQLYREEPIFRDELAACDEAIRKAAGFSIIGELEKPAETSRLNDTEVAQPALFSIEVALSALLQSWGIVPSAVIGHSVGEIAAAYVSGILDLAQASRLVCVRARVMQKATGRGKMVSVSLDEQAAKQAITGQEDRIGIAAVNDMHSVVLSGESAAIDSVVEKLSRDGVQMRPLRVNYAFHSPQMESLIAEFAEAVGSLEVKRATIPMLSTVTGKPVADGEINGDYWARNIRQTVRFADAIAASSAQVFVEVGPHPVLAMSIEQTLVAKNVVGRVIPTLRREKAERQQLLLALGALYTEGVAVEWNRLYPEGGRVVDLPTYPWQRQRYWFDTPLHKADLRSAGLTSAQHPLLGAITRLADGDRVVLTGRLSLSEQPWLADHAVHETVLVPGTGLLELAFAGARAVGQTSLSELTLEAPLVLMRKGGVRIQVLIQAPNDAGARALSLYSQSDEAPADSPWTRHAHGIVTTSPSEKIEADLTNWPPPGAHSVDLGDLYLRLAARGYQYGLSFQGLREVWRRGNELFAHAVLPENLHKDAADYGVHPALLDAALHAFVAISDHETEAVQLPFAFSDVALKATGPSELRVRFELPLANARERTISLSIADGSGQPVAYVGALQLRPASAHQIRSSTHTVERDLYRVEWTSVSLTEAFNPAAGWVLGGDGRFAKELGLQWISDIDELRDKLNRNERAPERLFIDCTWPIAEEKPLPDLVQRETAHVLQMLQMLLAEARLSKTSLIWLTRGAIATNPNDRGLDLARSSLWGLIRSARSENPDRALQLVDIDALSDLAATFAATHEPELVWRYGTAFAPRLQRVTENADSLKQPHVPNVQLHLPARGSLSDLEIIEAADAVAPLQRGQVRIAVRAAGVNFRDALNALGMVPAPWLGFELAGDVIEVGPEVAHISVGDRVMGLGQATFGTISIADALLVTRIPRHLSYVEAATIPLVFLTAFYALQDLGGIQSGERLLIHAAAGGVGMAAIQLARHWGVEVFGTASPGKWDMLRVMGLDSQHIANSRDLGFEKAFLNRTNGAGMDVVLNALAREFVDASLRLLPRGGRFLEMGKTDIRDAEDVAKTCRGVRYRAFDLMDAGAERIQSMLEQLCRLFEEKRLSPLPLSVYDMRQAHVAFKHLANGRNVGKLVLQPSRSLDTNGTSLITGGTGELGQSLAKHLVRKHGVKHLVLTSRQGANAKGADSLVSALKDAGADTVVIAACDVANSAEVAALIHAIPEDRPLRAVFHLAGVLDDGLVTALTDERLAHALRPKVAGAWNLHQQTIGLDLSAFVLFSSVSGVVGSAGQANYAAANTFLDALAAQRRKMGLAGQSLAWGFWEQRGVGMTAHLGAADLARMQRQGLAPMPVESGLGLLDAAMARPEAALVPVRLERGSIQATEGQDGTISPLIRALVQPSLHRVGYSPVAPQALCQRLMGLSEIERRDAVLDLVRREIVAVLGLAGVEGVPVDRPLQQLGLDSLMAVELRNRLASRAETTLPATLAFDYPTAAALTALLLSKFEPNTTSKWTTAEIQMKLQQVSIEALKKSDILAAFMALVDDHHRSELETHDENSAIDQVDDDGVLELLKKRLEGEGP